MRKAGYLIGEAAKNAGVSVDAIRFYEKRGLLAYAPRSDGGYRLFSIEHINRVRFIKEAQETGFSLDEIRMLLRGGGSAECRQMRDLLRSKLAESDERMKTLRAFNRRLRHHLRACEDELARQGDASRCPVLIEISYAAKRK